MSDEAMGIDMILIFLSPEGLLTSIVTQVPLKPTESFGNVAWASGFSKLPMCFCMQLELTINVETKEITAKRQEEMG